jgi:hypothetical protein
MGSRVLGVDFSGATDAGRSLWLTEARSTGEGLVVEDCYSAADEWGVDRERAHAGLRERATEFSVVGLDFPFSLPQALLDEHCGGTWRGLVAWLTGDGPGDPDTFASTCRSTARAYTGDGTAQLRRETDLRRAALCPYDSIVQYQTFHGVRNVLAGLADDPDAAVLPMQSGPVDTRVVEVYPAATFGWLGLYREGYKGDHRERRATNIEGIEACSVDIGNFRDAYESSHDALDSLAAAVSAGRVGADPPRHGPREEGHIYV